MEAQNLWTEHFENDKLRLKLLQREDFDDLFRVASDPAVWAEHPIHDRYKREVFQNYFDQAISSTAAFLIVDKATNKIVGCTRFHDYSASDSSVAIGFTFLAREYWGKEFNIASKRLLIDFAFTLVDRVFFLVGTENIRPQMTLKKLGAQLDGEVDYKSGNKSIGQFRYVISKRDWLGRPQA